MSAIVRLSLKELDEIIMDVEAKGGDASELNGLRTQVAKEERPKKAAEPLNKEEHIAELRGQSNIEHGTDLECLVCHNKVDQLTSDTCEACFRKWALSTKKV